MRPQHLKLKAGRDTPEVLFDADHGTLFISGRSMPEDAVEFFGPLHTWLEEYLAATDGTVELVLQLDYISSSSIKQLLRFLLILEKASAAGKKAMCIWKYAVDDDVMEMKGRELASMLVFPFEVEEYGDSEAQAYE